jgi:hypothetical protein
MWPVLRCYKQIEGQFSQFCTGVSEEKTSAGGREIAIVGAVIRKHLVTD